ncbi:MAG TPA: ankyrin repeat domain-containing protein [Gammaproteobacteria bacterium]|nr:ankyrin repeat domain-containing protein [Gammaproteobacteria bacterium]
MVEYDFYGMTLLTRLAYVGSDVTQAAEILKKNPEAVNARGKFLNETPLLAAVTGGTASTTFIKLLLEYGARLDVEYLAGRTVLHCVAYSTNIEHLDLLKGKAGFPDINYITNELYTPLHAVCMLGHNAATMECRKKMAAWLLDNGAKIWRNTYGNTPIQEARNQGLNELADFIEAYTPIHQQANNYLPLSNSVESKKDDPTELKDNNARLRTINF